MASQDASGDPLVRDIPLEVKEGKDYYAGIGNENALREPYEVPRELVQGIHERDPPPIPPTPVIAFVNSRSGGKIGPELLLALRRALGISQVFDLAKYKPDEVLAKLWANIEATGTEEAREVQRRLRIVAAGGDGTVAWILQVIARSNITPAPPVAIMPLGTGNDLARTFGWGGTFTKTKIAGHPKLLKTLRAVGDATPAPLDCWQLAVTCPSASHFKHKMPYSFVPEEATNGVVTRSALMWNYVSVGIDAQVAYRFHTLRESKPALASSQTVNKFWYGFFTCSSGWPCGVPPSLARRGLSLQLLVPTGPAAEGGAASGGGGGGAAAATGPGSGEWVDVPLPSSVRAIVLLNLPSYGGGMDLWGAQDAKAESRGYAAPSIADGLFEVVGITTTLRAGRVMAGIAHAKRLGQAAGARICVRPGAPAVGAAPADVPSSSGGDVGGKPEGDSKGGKEEDDEEEEEGMGAAYMQLDGEPWQQAVPLGGEVVVEVTHFTKSVVLVAPGSAKPQVSRAVAAETRSSAEVPPPALTSPAAGPRVNPDGTAGGNSGGARPRSAVELPRPPAEAGAAAPAVAAAPAAPPRPLEQLLETPLPASSGDADSKRLGIVSVPALGSPVPSGEDMPPAPPANALA